MPSPVKRFPRPKLMKIKWGKGKRRVLVYGRYKRTVDGKAKTSYAIKSLDRKRTSRAYARQPKMKRKVHRRYPHAVDLPKRKW